MRVTIFSIGRVSGVDTPFTLHLLLHVLVNVRTTGVVTIHTVQLGLVCTTVRVRYFSSILILLLVLRLLLAQELSPPSHSTFINSAQLEGNIMGLTRTHRLFIVDFVNCQRGLLVPVKRTYKYLRWLVGTPIFRGSVERTTHRLALDFCATSLYDSDSTLFSCLTVPSVAYCLKILVLRGLRVFPNLHTTCHNVGNYFRLDALQRLSIARLTF